MCIDDVDSPFAGTVFHPAAHALGTGFNLGINNQNGTVSKKHTAVSAFAKNEIKIIVNLFHFQPVIAAGGKQQKKKEACGWNSSFHGLERISRSGKFRISENSSSAFLFAEAVAIFAPLKFPYMKKLYFVLAALFLFILAMTLAFCYLNYNHG
jgi:hypothetical protein